MSFFKNIFGTSPEKGPPVLDETQDVPKEATTPTEVLALDLSDEKLKEALISELARITPKNVRRKLVRVIDGLVFVDENYKIEIESMDTVSSLAEFIAGCPPRPKGRIETGGIFNPRNPQPVVLEYDEPVETTDE